LGASPEQTYHPGVEPITDLADDVLARAVEDNEAEFLLVLGRAGGGEERDDAAVHWTIGGSPIGYHNAVVRASLDDEHADEMIVASRELMRTYGVPGSWHVGPSMRPDDLTGRLAALGFEGGPEPGMAADLHAMPEFALPEKLHVRRVASDGGLDDYEGVLGAGFGEGPPEAAWVREMYARIGLDDNTWRHFVGRIDGEPVATATTFLAAGVVGLYFVCTHPDARNRGIGAAISQLALAEARDHDGYRVGVLGSSPMGQRIYERIGFEVVCNVNVYEWAPGTRA
jgi:GNAT superfamily N-acetyltransferase